MELGNASQAITAHVEAEQERKGSVTNASALSAQERIFVDAFVGNGGNATAAVIAAGYSANGADVQACRLLSRPRIAERIKHQCGSFAHSTLPVAIRTLVEVCGNEALLPKDRIKAANSLIELAGLSAPKGGIQVNVGVVNGSQAQQIIAEVHSSRQRRLSDIPPAMPDTSLRQIEQSIEALATPIGDRAGGDHLQGPGVGSRPLPVYPPEDCEETDVSEPDPASRFRSAFDEGDE